MSAARAPALPIPEHPTVCRAPDISGTLPQAFGGVCPVGGSRHPGSRVLWDAGLFAGATDTVGWVGSLRHGIVVTLVGPPVNGFVYVRFGDLWGYTYETALDSSDLPATDRYGERYLQNPDISVGVKASTRRSVTVDGAVKQSGSFPVSGPLSLIQAVALAGGAAEDANSRRIAGFRAASW